MSSPWRMRCEHGNEPCGWRDAPATGTSRCGVGRIEAVTKSAGGSKEPGMCRFVLYMGPPITLDLLTTRPEYSIIHQSFKARLSRIRNIGRSTAGHVLVLGYSILFTSDLFIRQRQTKPCAKMPWNHLKYFLIFCNSLLDPFSS